MRLNIFQSFELWFLDTVIQLLSRSNTAQSFWKQMYPLLSGRMVLISLLISFSSFMGLISGFFFYMYAIGTR